MSKSSNAFETKLAQLEALVTQLESDELSLEDSLKVFEQGVKLSRQCQSALEKAEQKVAVLSSQATESEEQGFAPPSNPNDDDI